ncbi:SDR family oxidoreductase [Treponema parvum]|uniref:SDR family oxidoreductase n=1 Tax=Treponema parvum TaxID=138851 RepID=A0A975IEI3_9SPIR|nr:SDR family NAD(P)-dependent oxidoreductase [Treponema parvum]QTQ13857.1 SDR family oxidoreductase [Treponema parvum]
MEFDYKKKFSLSGKVAVVTGAVTGLGYAMAKCFAEAGAKVFITGVSDLTRVQKAAEEIGHGCEGLLYDITDESLHSEMVKKITDKGGRIDIVVCNAGVHCKKEVEDITKADFERVLGVHVVGAFGLIRAAVPYMKKQHSGSIIMISSMSAYLALTKVAAYGSAKGAVLGMVKCLSGDLAPFGIRVNAIAPGFIDTPMFHKAVDDDLPRQKKILGHTPMGIYGKPEDVAWAGLYLASDASGFVTGVSIPVDGGCSIGF